jgi:hypothetical protein
VLLVLLVLDRGGWVQWGAVIFTGASPAHKKLNQHFALSDFLPRKKLIARSV